MAGKFQVDVTESRCRLIFCFPASSKKFQRRILEFMLEFGKFLGGNHGWTLFGAGLSRSYAEESLSGFICEYNARRSVRIMATESF